MKINRLARANRTHKYPAEVHERAVRTVLELQSSHPSQWAAICTVAHSIGCTPETLRLWMRQAQRNGRDGAAPGSPRRMPLCAGPRILLVEDDRDMQALALSALEPYAVDVAGDGTSAVRLAELTPFDLILIDLELPRIDGFSAARAIRDLEIGHCRRPARIIAISAYAGEDLEGRMALAGMDGFLAKPIGHRRLREVVVEILHPAPQPAVSAALAQPAA